MIWVPAPYGKCFVPIDLDGNAEAARAALAKHIVDMGKKGERDPRLLIEGALIRFRP